MKVADTANKSSSAKNYVQAKRQPFFNKEGGQNGFFSKSTEPTTPFFNHTAPSSKGNEHNAIQPKLKIGKPNDKYEVEADAMADKVVQKLAAPTAVNSSDTTSSATSQQNTIQAKSQAVEKEDELQTKTEESITETGANTQLKPIFESTTEQAETAIQAKLMPTAVIQKQVTETEEELQQREELSESEEDVQAMTMDGGTVGGSEGEDETIQTQSETAATNTDSDLQSQLDDSKGGGNPLPSETQSAMGSAMGADFSAVRTHTGGNAVQMNKDLGAQAFTHGNDIYFNEGKYDTSSGTGQHLLAHELTHTVQQGASKPTVQKSEAVTTKETTPTAAVAATRPNDPLDISHRFELTEAWANYLDAQHEKGKRKLVVTVKIGNRYSGTIEVSKVNTTITGKLAKYELAEGSLQRYLDISGWSFLNPMRQAGIDPILVLKPFGEGQTTTGFLSIKSKNLPVLGQATGFIEGLNSTLTELGFLGIDKLTIPKGGIENTFENERLVFQVKALSTIVDGFLKAGGGLGITGEMFTFNLNTDVDVAGLAQGQFLITRNPDGKLGGQGTIQATIANVQAIIMAEYIDGVVTIQGTGQVSSEKFTGALTFLVTDAARSKQMMRAALGTETMDGEKQQAPTKGKGEAKKVTKTPKNQVLAGWGEVDAAITPWLKGNAKIGIDHEGHITIVGKVAVPNEVKLMEQQGKKQQLFDAEIRAGYGIPLVGQVFLFAGVGMFVNAGFGPLVLKNAGFTGTYSTDPKEMQNFNITGTLGINAFAVLGLEAEAGVGVTLLGHDLKAGVNVTAAAGLRAYAEATPTFEYKEAKAPEGGKVGESRLKGHFEAAAQLFLQLSGSLFYELDSPWWSPAPDGRTDFPLGQVQYPLGDSLGIGADVDWLVGSKEAPELKLSPVEFDPNKFTADVMADPPPKKLGNSEVKPEGKWKGEGGKGTPKDPKATGKGKGLPNNGKQKENLKKLPDQQKYMRALDEMSKLEKVKPKPTRSVVQAKAQKIKAKYGLEQIQLRGAANDSNVNIYVKHKKENNGKHLLKIPLMNPAEAKKLRAAAMTDLRVREKNAVAQDGTIEESAAKSMLQAWQKAYPVVESTKVVDGKATWDYFIDFGDVSNMEKGKRKKGSGDTKGLKVGDGEIGEVVPFKAGKENHKLWVRVTSGKPEIMVASVQMTVDAKLSDWSKRLATLSTDDQKKAKEWLGSANSQYKIVKQKAALANNAKKAAEEKPGDESLSNTFIKADNEVEQLEGTFKEVLAKLFKIFGEEVGEISFNEKLVEAYFVTNNKGKKRKRRIYLEKENTSYILYIEADNPKTYREFINSIDLDSHKNKEEAIKAKEAAEPILKAIEAIIKSGPPEGSTDKQKKDYLKKVKPKKIDKEAEKLIPYTKTLFERESDIPESTDPKYGVLSSNPLIASSMEVEKLTKNNEKGSVPTTDAHDVYDVLNKRRKGDSSYYVKGHLLNEHVSGPGDYFNLTPLSKKGNNAHLNNAENSVKIAVASGAVVYYKVKIGGGTYSPGIPSKAAMDAAGIEERNHEDLKEVRKMEKYVPRYLVVTAYNLKEDADGEFTKKEPVFQNKKIDNHIDTNLGSYKFKGDEGNANMKIVLTSTKLAVIAKEIKIFDSEILEAIIGILKNNKGLRSLESLKTYLDKSSLYSDDDKTNFMIVIKQLEKYPKLQIRNYKKT